MLVEIFPFISEDEKCTFSIPSWPTNATVDESKSGSTAWVEGQQGLLTAAALMLKAVRYSGATVSSATKSVRGRGALCPATVWKLNYSYINLKAVLRKNIMESDGYGFE